MPDPWQVLTFITAFSLGQNPSGLQDIVHIAVKQLAHCNSLGKHLYSGNKLIAFFLWAPHHSPLERMRVLELLHASAQIPTPQSLVSTIPLIITIICVEIIWINYIIPFTSIFVGQFRSPRLSFISQTHPIWLSHPYPDLIFHFSPNPETLPLWSVRSKTPVCSTLL